MGTVGTWTGLEANALRKALRMSLTDFAAHIGVARRTVVKWSSRGVDVKPRPEMQSALDTVLARASYEVRDRFGVFCTDGDQRAQRSTTELMPAVPVPDAAEIALWVDGGSDPDGRIPRRGAVDGLAALSLAPAVERVTDALFTPEGRGSDGPVHRLVSGASAAKADYQACRYAEALERLAALIPNVELARAHAGDDGRLVVQLAATDLYHVLGSVLLKLGERTMALIAAERSTQCGRASHDPLAVATSARIMTHALMSNDHAERAVRLASHAAIQLDRETRLKAPKRSPFLDHCCYAVRSPPPAVGTETLRTRC